MISLFINKLISKTIPCSVVTSGNLVYALSSVFVYCASVVPNASLEQIVNLKMQILYQVCLFMLCCAAAHGAVDFGGQCPRNVQTLQDFNPSLYTGRWYEYAKYPFIFELFGRCVTADYGLLPTGEVSVLNRQINTITGNPTSIEGKARVASPGKLLVSFSSVPSFVGPGNYWVLDTDYQNYSVVWSCSISLGFVRSEVAWILTREQHPRPEIIDRAKQVLLRNGISLDRLTITDQNC